MESHVLNSYHHQARYGLHNVNRIASSDCSSDGGNINSPEYREVAFTPAFSQNSTVYCKKEQWEDSGQQESSQTMSSDSDDDDEENSSSSESEMVEVVDAVELPMYGRQGIENGYYRQENLNSSEEEYEDSVDNNQYLEVYAIDPNAQMSSDDEDKDDSCIKSEQSDADSEESDTEETNNDNYSPDSLVVSCIDDNNQGHVVDDLDDYFNKDIKPVVGHVVSNVDEYFIKGTNKAEKGKVPETVEAEKQNTSTVKPNISDDLHILPHIENIKMFLLEGMPGARPHNKLVQRSCSLPHSPAHLPSSDDSSVKMRLSLEDVNIGEFSDFSFDKSGDKSSFLDGHVKPNESPRLLTDDDVDSFFVNIKTEKGVDNVADDLNHEDMELEMPIESKIQYPSPVVKVKTEPWQSQSENKSKILDFCIEKTENGALLPLPDQIKYEVDEDDIDVESFTDSTMLPVLEANNLSSLLEQFEASESLNNNVKKEDIAAQKTIGLTNGVRLQDAAVQLNKTKLRNMMITSSSSKSATTKSENVHSDHDYCSPEKRRPSIRVKAGQSLLKPEVLSSNSEILSSRHRSCKNKKIVYNVSSDEEIDSNRKAKSSVRSSFKTELHSNHRKKLSPINSVTSLSSKDKSANSVITKCALKASDKDSQTSGGCIKLTIKNKSKVILNLDCDDKKDSHSIVHNNNKVKTLTVASNGSKKQKENTRVDIKKRNLVNKEHSVDTIKIKEEPRPVKEDFYMNLFTNERDVHVPQMNEISPVNSFLDVVVKQENIENKQPQKKKLNLFEYKLRKEATTKTKPVQLEFSDADKVAAQRDAIVTYRAEGKIGNDPAVKVFDPIREASRKILMNTQKQLAKRKRDEDIIMTKIPKVESLELQPLISDADMLKMVGNGVIPKEPLAITPSVEKPKHSSYEEITLVSIGTNTDEQVFKLLQSELYEQDSPPSHKNKVVNFKIRSSDKISKENVFDSRKLSPGKEPKMDKERFKDITATIKSVEKKVEKKILSNSLFASIQDVVMKKALDDAPQEKRKSRSYSPVDRNRRENSKTRTKVNAKIVRLYDANNEHGEDKVILHLEKARELPKRRNMVVQTDASSEFGEIVPFGQRSKHVSESSDSCKSDSRRDSNRYRRSRSRSRSRSHKPFKRHYPRGRSTNRYRNYRRSYSPYRKRFTPSRNFRYQNKSPSRILKRSSSDKFDSKRLDVANRIDSPPRTPLIRKPTVSESSDSSSYTSSSTSSSSSSRSSGSYSSGKSRSTKRRRSFTPEYKAKFRGNKFYDDLNDTPVEERRIVFVGKLDKDISKSELKSQFLKFGSIIEVTVHSKENGNRYGFVTFERARDAFNAVGAAASFPQYDVGFGGRRAFCRQRYADLDDIEATYIEGAYRALHVGPSVLDDNIPFEQMLQEMKNKLSKKRKFN